MSSHSALRNLTAAVALALLPFSAALAEPGCKAIHADLIETRVTTGCNPGVAVCFLGEVSGNHGLRGTTHFRGDSGAAGPSTASPGFISYSGPFQYRTATGTLDMRSE